MKHGVDPSDRDQRFGTAGAASSARALSVSLPSAASLVPGGRILATLLLAGMLAVLTSMMWAWASLALGLPRHEFRIFLFVVYFSGGMFCIPGLVALCLAGTLRRRLVTIGADGILFQKALTTEFIPYAKLSSVAPDPSGACLVRANGQRLLVPLGPAAKTDPSLPTSSMPKSREETLRLMLERIGTALSERRARAISVAASALDRNGRRAADWRDELLRLGSDAAHYRRAELSPERLRAVVDDSDAPAERRVAAAIALGAREGDSARLCVRVVAQTCADGHMQAALEAAADGEIDEARLARAAKRQRAWP